MRKFAALFLLSPILFSSTAVASESEQHCSGKVCVSVSTDPSTGGVTIHARSNTKGSSPSLAKPAPRPTLKRVVRPTLKATHRPYVRKAPSPARTTHRVTRIKKKVSTPQPSQAPEISLSDQLTQLIPTSQISVTPQAGEVTGVPATLSSSAPTLFTTTAQLLGVDVGLSLHPLYMWDFGDGTPTASTSVYQTFHTYKNPGSFIVTLSLMWGGTWSAGGYSYPVTGGAILQHGTLVVPVHPGPTRFHG